MCKPYLSLALSAAGFLCSVFVQLAQAEVIVLLAENAHVCNSEAETQRLADNDQLREMAKALVEFKPTKYCFILPPAANVRLLERHPSYIKFDYKSQVLFTFDQYVQSEAIAQNH